MSFAEGMRCMKKRNNNWAGILILIAAMLFLTACSGQKTGEYSSGEKTKTGDGGPAAAEGNGSGELVGAAVYLPEFLSLEGGEADCETVGEVSYKGMKLVGDTVYYLSGEGTEQQNLCAYNLTDSSVKRTALGWPEESRSYLGNYVFGQDGSMYALAYEIEGAPDLDEGRTSGDSAGTMEDLRCSLVKFDSLGNWICSWEVTSQLQEENNGEHATYLAVDPQGRIYLSGHTRIWLFTGEGISKGSLDLGSSIRINALGCDRDGRMYVSYGPDGRTENCTLARIDFDKRETVEIASNFPYCSGTDFVSAGDRGFLIQDDKALYQYDLETKSRKAVLIWADCGVGGSWVESVGVLEDGRLFAVLDDWEGSNSQAVLLTEAGAEQIPQKETLVMGTLYIDYDTQDAVNRFNMANEYYNIQIKEYADETALNLDIVSGRCPDIIEFGNLHIEYMIEKGLFEDLNPYLERSDKLSREDFFPGIMNAYVFDGIQVALPKGFEVETVIGKTERVGSEIGWTLEEMMEFAESYPDSVLFDRPKKIVMRMLMKYNESLFVDWETGRCSFDSDEFRRLLEFVNSGLDQTSWDREESYVAKMRTGEVLLWERTMEIEEIQVLEEIFGGEVTLKGLPTPEGTSGATTTWSSAYAITAKSEHKDAAWEFLETFFTESNKHSGWFPGLKWVMEEGILQAMKINHDGVEYGNYIGEIDGVPYTYRAATQEEVDRILALIDDMEPLAAQCDKEIENIIVEEAESYFKGQKSVEDVMEIIQGRVQMYVNEKR